MKRLFALLLAAAMCFALLSGCGGNTTESPAGSADASEAAEASTPETDTAEEAEAAEESAEITDIEIEEVETEEVTYPLVEDGSVTVEYWFPVEANALQKMADRDDLQLWSEMRRITGVDVDLTMIAATNIATLFPLTIASGDMPDMWMDFSAYTNGFDDAIEEGIVEPLNDYLSVMPNLNAILEGDKEMRRQCDTDSGYFAAIPSIKVVGDGHQAQGPWFGYVARKDWLDEMNMDVPETYDDLEKVMDAMMQQYDTVKTPIYMSMGIEANPFADPVLYGGYGVTGNYIQVDGEVRYSPLEDGYKGYVEMLHRWIEKGYLSTDFPYNILPWLDTGEAAEQSYGVFPMIYTWFDGYKATVPDDDFDLVALKPLKVDAGDTVHIGSSGLMASPAGAICADSENIELICKWWDYLFGEEGITLGNWGIEGKTYEVKDNGEKTWIGPFVNEDNDPGFDLSMVQWEYLVFNMPGYIQVDREYCLVDDKAVEFIDQWDDCETDYNYPMGATMTAEENQAYASRFNDLNTYVTEQTLRFIMGESSFDEWDTFIDTVYSMGAEELTTYKQAALDRYNNR